MTDGGLISNSSTNNDMTVNDNFFEYDIKTIKNIEMAGGIKFVAECGRYVRNRIWNLCILTGNNCSIEVI
jgi:hypothetical protein